MQSVNKVFEENARVREALRQAVAGLSDEQLAARPEGEAWSIQEIVEHISVVNDGISRICAKMVAAAAADGRPGDGNIYLSSAFTEAVSSAPNQKLEAPERVRPSGQVSVSDSFSRLDETAGGFEAIRDALGAYDLSAHKFPHPYFGDLTAGEWFVLAGGHEMRHVRQIERVKAKL